MRIVTHSGRFHTDDLFAVSLLKLLYPEAEIIRSRDEAIIASADIVVDVGGVYDEKHLRFDHHQPEGAGSHENDIPYASFGLVWITYGEKFAENQEVSRILNEKLVMPIDAIDNGIELSSYIYDGIREYSLYDYIHSFAYNAETPEDFTRVFFEVLPLAQSVLKNELVIAQKEAKDSEKTRKIYEQSENKRIIVIPSKLSWEHALIPSEAQFVIYQRTEGNWGAKVVRKKLNSFEAKKPFPESWAGKTGEEFIKLTGVDDAKLCHRARYLAVAQSKEGAIKLAEKALNA